MFSICWRDIRDMPISLAAIKSIFLSIFVDFSFGVLARSRLCASSSACLLPQYATRMAGSIRSRSVVFLISRLLRAFCWEGSKCYRNSKPDTLKRFGLFALMHLLLHFLLLHFLLLLPVRRQSHSTTLRFFFCVSSHCRIGSELFVTRRYSNSFQWTEPVSTDLLLEEPQWLLTAQYHELASIFFRFLCVCFSAFQSRLSNSPATVRPLVGLTWLSLTARVRIHRLDR